MSRPRRGRQGRQLSVVRFRRVEDIKTATSSSSVRQRQGCTSHPGRAAARPMLTVGETESFTIAHDSFLTEQNRVRLEVNVERKSRGLTITRTC